MSGLTEQDLHILEHYAREGNRELYWNYLAQKEGADGYGLLALGVVRNDSMPGATANHFADNRARADGRRLSERDWERFGEDLIKRDFALRIERFEDGRPDLALNLPVEDVQHAHDGAFRQAHIDPNAWTPRQLLEAARRQGGEQEAEKVWDRMLDGRVLGIERAWSTTRDIVFRYNDGQLDAWDYYRAIGSASTTAAADRDRTDPDIIGAKNYYHRYDERENSWHTIVTSMTGATWRERVTDPETINKLNDARSVRLETEAQRDDFHPDDPNRNRPIARSPFTLADAGQAPDADVQLARANAPSQAGPASPAAGFDHPLYQQAFAAISRRDAELGREPDDNSRNIAVASATLAARNGYQRIDDIAFNVATGKLAAGERFFVIERGNNPEVYRRDSMITNEALAMTTEQREQQLALVDTLQTRAMETRGAQLAQEEQVRTQNGPQMA